MFVFRRGCELASVCGAFRDHLDTYHLDPVTMVAESFTHYPGHNPVLNTWTRDDLDICAAMCDILVELRELIGVFAVCPVPNTS